MKLFIFDLDFTLWDAGGTWCDHTNPPYRKEKDYVLDSFDSKIMLYPDVIDILEYLKKQNIQTGVASRTGEPAWARELIRLFGIEHYFTYKEIYPSDKTKHFSRIREKSGIAYADMVFFDDEIRNIYDVEALGVHAVYVEAGVNLKMVKDILK